MPPWTKALILDALTRWVEDVGEVPACQDWETKDPHPHWVRHRGHFPTRQTVSKYFGSWRKALAAAGFEPRPPGRKRGRVKADWTRDAQRRSTQRLRERRRALRDELAAVERELSTAEAA